MTNKKLAVPHNCYLILTADCNMRCSHCYGNYGVDVPKDELSGKEWISVIEDLSKNGIFFVNISGGEPTMHPDFVEIIKSLKKNEIYFMLTTNGVFSKKTQDAILDARDYILGIQISLDGPNWESHGFIRKDLNGKARKNLYDLALNSIKVFTGKGIRINVATCLSKGNIDLIDKMKKLIISIKPRSWSISTISISGRAKSCSDLYVPESAISKKYWKELKNECECQNIKVNFVDMPNTIKKNSESIIYYECPAAKWFCEIYSDGTTTPCPLARVNPVSDDIKWENIKEKSIKEIWENKPFSIFRDFQKRGCDGCKAKNKCDRCPPQSVQWFEDPLMPPPYCIENGENLCLNKLDELKDKLKESKIKNNREKYGIVEE
jgi:MoaA/NifB/PqqE/SkfB family radical SAM enzyme